jgi:DNA mismatch repair endonuclease MutH
MDWRTRFTKWPLPYDYTDAKSIESHGKKLLDSVLRAHVPPEHTLNKRGKGEFGVLLEKYYFFKIPDSRPEPDFPEAGVELKSTPIKRFGPDKFVPKERLVLGMIDYDRLKLEEWNTNSFIKKNGRLLLVVYLYEHGKSTLDYEIKAVTLWRFPEEDLKIIQRDWEYILGKIANGTADELSEGDTLYLGACTKGATGASRRRLSSGELVKPRAFALKQGYMRIILHKYILGKQLAAEPFLKTRVQKSRAGDFEALIISRFEPFIGKKSTQIAAELDLQTKREAKNFLAEVTRAILGQYPDDVEEFQKAEIVSRTIRIRPDGLPREHISFPAFKPMDLVKETWDSSALRQLLIRRFFFVIWQADDRQSEPVLHRTMFWSMPARDREFGVRAVWEDTIQALKSGHTERLPKISQSKFSHVRPHGRDSSDTVPAPKGKRIVRQCFWLNAEYVRFALGLGKHSKPKEKGPA